MSTENTYPPQSEQLVQESPRIADAPDAELLEQDPAHTDDGMMYPWSIGTTRAAREHVSPRRKEECPPEVYIG